MDHENIEAIIQDVRAALSTDRLGRHPTTTADTRDALYGYCVENAEALANRLAAETDYRVEIAEGGLDLNHEPTPASYDDAQQDGTVHHWVVLTDADDGRELHCDLAREGNTLHDTPLLAETPPREYIDFGRRRPVS